MFVIVTFIAMLMTPIALLLTSLYNYANRNNGDKFYRRKSMWAVDEKLIINELGPKIVYNINSFLHATYHLLGKNGCAHYLHFSSIIGANVSKYHTSELNSGISVIGVSAASPTLVVKTDMFFWYIRILYIE